MPLLLLADRDTTLLEVLQESLQREGFQVNVVMDGQAAVESFHQNHPDLLLLDLHLPFQGGLEICRRLRAVAPTPIILTIPLSDEPQRLAALEAGADQVLSKPFTLRELLARIRAILRRVDLDTGV